MSTQLLIKLLPILLLFACQEKSRIATLAKVEFVVIDSVSVPEVDSEMVKLYEPYKQILDSTMNEKIGFSRIAIERGQPNGNLNNLVADIVFQHRNFGGMKADFCLLNYGGLRNNLPEGFITRSDIFQLMPFPNKIVMLKINASTLDSIVQNIFENNGQPIAGLNVTFSKNKTRKILINGIPFDKKKNYVVITSDYLAHGGDKMQFLTQADTLIETNITIRDAIFAYFENLKSTHKQLVVDTKTRVIYEK